MKKVVLPILFVLAIAGCKEKKEAFVVYPNAQALPQLTDLFKRGAQAIAPDRPIPPQQLFDVDAPVDEVATFYAKENGFPSVAPDATGNLSSVKPPAYFRTGDLGVDAAGMQPILQKLNMNVDITKAKGTYRAAEVSANGEKPRVTVQRPYFDPNKQQVIDRTLIIMAK